MPAIHPQKNALQDIGGPLSAWWRSDTALAEAGREFFSRRAMREDGPPDWLLLAEQLWGIGNVRPGEENFRADITNTLDLSGETTLAYFNIGLGGAARGLAGSVSLSVTGYERTPEAAVWGSDLCKRLGKGRKVSIARADYDRMVLAKDKFHYIVGKDAFHAVSDKARLFGQLARGLKPGGSLLFTDYVTSAPLSPGDCIVVFGSRPPAVSPCSQDDFQKLLSDCGFVLRSSDDLTERYVGFITEGWSNLRAILDHLEGHAANPARALHFVQNVANEAAVWANRLDALRSGRLSIRRYLANKPA